MTRRPRMMDPLDPCRGLSPQFSPQGKRNPTQYHFLTGAGSSFPGTACGLNGATTEDLDQVGCPRCRRTAAYRGAVALKEGKS